MKAEIIFYRKDIQRDGSVVEMKAWKVPVSERYLAGIKYSLYWIKHGAVLIGYDNHFPKGPHCHYGHLEVGYDFSGLDRLVRDFYEDVQRGLDENP
jgi:hypothetical protein